MQMNEMDLVILDSTIEAMKQVIMHPLEVSSPDLINQGFAQHGIAVLIGIVGNVQGRLVFQAEPEIFSKLGETMFGMPLEGEMLHSFIGEVANMIAGNTSTILSAKGKHVDITPPTILKGDLKIFGFESGVQLSVQVQGIGAIHIAMLFHNKGGAQG